MRDQSLRAVNSAISGDVESRSIEKKFDRRKSPLVCTAVPKERFLAKKAVRRSWTASNGFCPVRSLGKPARGGRASRPAQRVQRLTGFRIFGLFHRADVRRTIDRVVRHEQRFIEMQRRVVVGFAV